MDLKLSGKTCLVTGASAGIGVGIAHSLAREGVRLTILARRRERLEDVAAAIEAETGNRPAIVVADLMDREAPAAVLAAVGTVEILINNAGLSSKPEIIASDERCGRNVGAASSTSPASSNPMPPAPH